MGYISLGFRISDGCVYESPSFLSLVCLPVSMTNFTMGRLG